MRIATILLFAFLSIYHSGCYAEHLQIFTEEWRPISFSDNSGHPDGLGVDVVQEILKRLKIKDNIKIVPWARGWKMVTENPNVVLFTVTRTDDREKLFTMIGPIATGTTNFYVRKGSSIKLKTLNKAKEIDKIAVYRAAVEEQILLKEGFTNISSTSLPLQSAKMLLLGRVDMWCTANLTAEKILEEAGHSINDVENVFTIRENHLYIAFSKGTSEHMVDMWKETLEQMKQDGTFNKIYNKWLPGELPPEKTELIGVLR